MMTLQQKRDKIRAITKDPLTLVGDNLIFVQESMDIVHWDDENEQIVSVTTNEDRRFNYGDQPFTLIIAPYENFQYIQVSTDEFTIQKLAKDFGMDPESVASYVKNATSIKL